MAVILFSPIGGTDPISQYNMMDGSMLHITRVYKPDRIYLYLSAEMYKLHLQDDRFQYCLHKLFELQKREPAEIKIIPRPTLEEVQEYDYFYDDFYNVLKSILQDIQPDDTLLLNVSSGTPAMKSALLVLATLREFPCKAIQVVTPDKKMNEHHHKGYDVATCWELDGDNDPGFESRTRELRCPTLSRIQIENSIRQHIRAYDYVAALRAAEDVPAERSGLYIDYLRMGAARFHLDHTKVTQLYKKTRYACYPYTNEEDRLLFEYLLSLDVRVRREMYADFIRALSPALFHLFTRIIDLYTPLDTKKLIIKKDDKSVWNWEEVQMNKLDDYIDSSIVYNRHLLKIIVKVCKDEEIQSISSELRGIEEAIRNQVAHDIFCATDEVIKIRTGYSALEIMNKLKIAARYAGIKAGPKEWASYDSLNKKILEIMDT